MPKEPAAHDISLITSRTTEGFIMLPRRMSVITLKASVSRASPARMATASPNTLWFVGIPLLRSSLSMAGRSSWISEYVWIISRAHATGIPSSILPPAASQDAMQRTGLILFPPAIMLYLMALCKVAGISVSLGRYLSRASSTIFPFSPRYFLISIYASSVSSSNGTATSLPSIFFVSNSTLFSAFWSSWEQKRVSLTPSSKSLRDSFRNISPFSILSTIPSSFFIASSNFSAKASLPFPCQSFYRTQHLPIRHPYPHPVPSLYGPYLFYNHTSLKTCGYAVSPIQYG